jgi:hypothetical protein
MDLQFLLQECRDCGHVIIAYLLGGCVAIPNYPMTREFLDAPLWVTWTPSVRRAGGAEQKPSYTTYENRAQRPTFCERQKYATGEFGDKQCARARDIVVLSQTCTWLRAFVMPYFKPIYEMFVSLFGHYMRFDCCRGPYKPPTVTVHPEFYAYAVYGLLFNSYQRAKAVIQIQKCTTLPRFKDSYYLVQHENAWHLKLREHITPDERVHYRVIEGFPRWFRRPVSHVLEAIEERKKILRHGKRILKAMRSFHCHDGREAVVPPGAVEKEEEEKDDITDF